MPTFYDIIKMVPKGRWEGIKRAYGVEDVLKLRGTTTTHDYKCATLTSNKLWAQMESEPYVATLGAITGNQAMQMVRAGLQGIYLSGWQVAADGNVAGAMYPDQSLYPANSGPELAKRIIRALERCDQIEHSEGGAKRDWIVPIVADAEAGFGGPLNCFEIMKAYMEAGVAGVHFEDQLAAEKKCGHLGGKVLIPTASHIRNLNAARLGADVCGVPAVLICRTDAESATLITSDVDQRDVEFIDYKAGRTPEGFYRLREKSGVAHAIARGVAMAPYADLLWCETSTPDLQEAQRFADGVRKVHPGKLLAYNCSPSFNWRANLSEATIAKFQRELGAMGYKFQFITLAGFHSINLSMFKLAAAYKQSGMTAYSQLQQEEFDSVSQGYTAVRHQREVGTGYFDLVATAAAGGKSSTAAYAESTEKAQFSGDHKKDRQGANAQRKFSTMATSTGSDADVKFSKPIESAADRQVLSPEAQVFLTQLHQKFESKRQKLLSQRRERQIRLDQGEKPNFLVETADIRKDDRWRIKGTPKDLEKRWVEITGPVDRKMVINALNSGANTYMADFEDSTSPTWRNVLEGQKNLIDAVRGQIGYKDESTGKSYQVGANPAVLMVRPRGWHLSEAHMKVDGTPISGSLFDLGLFCFHNAKQLVQNGTGPYFYLPKLENHREAQLWNEVLNLVEDKLHLQRGTIKVTVLIEHVLATFEADEILYALSDHIVGLNCGRWDYIFSYIKAFRNHSAYVLPDRSNISMMTPFMRNYSLNVVKTCHKRGAHAMGGMAAQIPIKNDPEANDLALKLVNQDKLREVGDGHDGTWVAHPGLVPIAMKVFADQLGAKANQLDRQRPDVHTTAEGLIEIPRGTLTEKGVRHNINVTLGYLEAWLRGNGCVPLYNLMEDAATAEISRSQLWQWRKHGAKLQDGRQLDNGFLQQLVTEEKQKWLKSHTGANKFEDASQLLASLTEAPEMPDFLTLSAYQRLIAEGQ